MMYDILIVEDHPIVVEGLQKLLIERELVTKAAVAYTASECNLILKSYTPQLVLLDYHLPDGNGIDLCKSILSQFPETKIIAITSFKEHTLVKRMMDNGAMGYVLKNSTEDEIYEAIVTVLSGKKCISEEARIILNEGESTSAILTRRELEVLKLISDGFTNPEIADKLFVSPSTVDSHRKNLILKLNVKNTAMLVKIAMQKGYV